MASAYIAISFLKQTHLLEKQLRIFFSYSPQEPLKEYLSNANIYKGRRNMSKPDLIDMVITEKSKKIVYTEENDELTKEEAREILKIIILLNYHQKKMLKLIQNKIYVIKFMTKI